MALNEHLLTALQASERHQRDARFRATAQAIAHHVMREHGTVDPERADREASDIALRACAMLLERIYRDDPEIAQLVIERDHYKKFAEETAGLRPMPVIVATSQIEHIDGDRTNNSPDNLRVVPIKERS